MLLCTYQYEVFPLTGASVTNYLYQNRELSKSTNGRNNWTRLVFGSRNAPEEHPSVDRVDVRGSTAASGMNDKECGTRHSLFRPPHYRRRRLYSVPPLCNAPRTVPARTGERTYGGPKSAIISLNSRQSREEIALLLASLAWQEGPRNAR